MLETPLSGAWKGYEIAYFSTKAPFNPACGRFSTFF
jgi:hypothetical protein